MDICPACNNPVVGVVREHNETYGNKPNVINFSALVWWCENCQWYLHGMEYVNAFEKAIHEYNDTA